jgi:hypothetical protein
MDPGLLVKVRQKLQAPTPVFSLKQQLKVASVIAGLTLLVDTGSPGRRVAAEEQAAPELRTPTGFHRHCPSRDGNKGACRRDLAPDAPYRPH